MAPDSTLYEIGRRFSAEAPAPTPIAIAEALSPESLERQFATTWARTASVRAFLPSIAGTPKRTRVFASFVFGRYVVPYIDGYAASKWALEALAEPMSFELPASGVDITIVEPGIFATHHVHVMTTPDDTAYAATYDAGAARIMQAMVMECNRLRKMRKTSLMQF